LFIFHSRVKKLNIIYRKTFILNEPCDNCLGSKFIWLHEKQFDSCGIQFYKSLKKMLHSWANMFLYSLCLLMN